MSFVAPLWLAVAGIAAAGAVIAHLFSTNVPPRQVLPTVRFIPQGAPMPVLRTRRLADPGLLLLRLLAIVLFGLALAGTHVPRPGPARVIVLDASRAGATAIAEAAESAKTTDRVIVFDSSAHAVDASALDTMRRSAARGSLSAGLVAAHWAIAHVTSGREAIELVIVSPVVREEVDSATAKLIALWEGAVRIRRIPAATPPTAGSVEIRAAGDDPVAATLSAASRRSSGVAIRIVRDRFTPADSTWVSDRARVVVLWPSVLSAVSDSSASSAWSVRRREDPDSAHGFATETHTVVGHFQRAYDPAPGRVIARWIDGRAAATEIPNGEGCIRVVAIPVDPVGDIALRESFRGFVRELIEPCGGARDFAEVPDSQLVPRAKPAAAGIAPAASSRLPPVLALLALVTLAAEQALRRRKAT